MLQLAYPIKDTVIIDNETYELNLTFDNVLRLFDMLDDKEIDDVTQIEIGLQMLLGVELAHAITDKEKIFYELFNNTIGKETKKSQPVDLAGNPMPTNDSNKPDYCLKQDASLIYASFYKDYGIDLHDEQGKMHWYMFQSLLNGLSEDTIFMKVIDIRKRPLPTGKGTSKEREQLKELKEYYALKGDD